MTVCPLTTAWNFRHTPAAFTFSLISFQTSLENIDTDGINIIILRRNAVRRLYRGHPTLYHVEVYMYSVSGNFYIQKPAKNWGATP